MFSFDQSKSNISRLVEDFHNKIKIIKTDEYKEANVEDEFIKPLFKYLNWNISNEGIKNVADREFIVQAKGKGGKEPDYLLQLEGKPCFFIEAKHPRYDLFKEIKYIWQAYSYAYSTQASSERKKVDFSLLTDFEEFRLFDCTFKADPKTVNNFTVLDWKYTDYVDKFSDLWDVFEKENVRKGSLKSLYINEKQIKQNRIPPDKAFLDDLDDEKTGWRILLAKDIKKYNPELTSDFITAVIQLIIDRFVFIKVLSDREIEDDFLSQIIEQIDKAAIKTDEGILNDTCKDLFAKMDKTYNGSVFERRKELDSVKLSNKTLHNILKTLLPENSRYNFKVIPVEILGTIYEQFLGKIVVTTDKRASIEYKPEVRKAGGVYYTPQYIVDYIVEKTVGKPLLKCKTITDLMNIKICDPACGSGSFLLGAYEKLIAWTIEYYFKKIKNEKELTKKESELFYQDNNGNIRLTAKIKRDILKSCIYGVDIDPQAVEVTKMSLSLKALEDTKHDELYNEVNLFHEAVLPDLSENIKCGNSLISTDIYGLFQDISTDDEKKLNPFNWLSTGNINKSSSKNNDKGFPEIMNKGGFDIIIGNPPYISIEELTKKQGDYFLEKYETTKGRVNTFSLFLERTNLILKRDGISGYIVSNRILTNTQLDSLRNFILTKFSINEIVTFKKMVFKDASVDTIVLIFKKTDEMDNTIEIKLDRSEHSINDKLNNSLKANTWLSNPNYIFNLEQNESLNHIFEKIEKVSTLLENVCEVKDGIILGSIKDLFLSNKKIDSRYEKFLEGNCVSRYSTKWDGKWICYDKDLNQNELQVKSSQFKAIKNDSEEFKRKSQSGVRLREKYIFEQPKIITRQNAKKIIGTFDTNNYFVKNSLHCTLEKDKRYNLKLILGILNSKMMDFYFQNKIGKTGELFSQMKIEYIKKLPIIKYEFIKKDICDKIISLVDSIIIENDRLNNSSLEAEINSIHRKISFLDSEIDKLVFELYNITDDASIIYQNSCNSN